MSQTQIVHPHALFFEKVFSRKDVSVDFFQNYLPESIVNRLDLSTIHLEKQSFISNELKASQSDLLFRVKTKEGKSLFIYFLFEHKSFLDRWVMFQLLGYIVKICELQREINSQKRQMIKEQLEKNGKSGNASFETEYLEPVIPIIIYHGKSKWDSKKNLSSLFYDGSLYQKYLPNFQYELIDTADFADDQFKGIVLLRVAMLVMKHYNMDDFKEKVPELLGLLVDLYKEKDSDIGFIEVLLRYIGTHKKCDKEWLTSQVKCTFKEKGEEIMNSVADIWIEEGKKEGKEEGKKEGILEEARRMVIEALMVKYNNISQSMKNILQEIKDRYVLSNLHREAILSKSLNEFQLRLDACQKT